METTELTNGLIKDFNVVMEDARKTYKECIFDYEACIKSIVHVLERGKMESIVDRKQYEELLYEMIRRARTELSFISKDQIDNLLKLSAAYFNTTIEELTQKGNRRGGSITKLEELHMAISVAYRYIDMPMEQMEQYFNRGYANMVCVDRKLSGYCKVDRMFKEKYIAFVKYMRYFDKEILRGTYKFMTLKQLYENS
jgi:galactose-1-phosphate uridylyltransferase